MNDPSHVSEQRMDPPAPVRSPMAHIVLICLFVIIAYSNTLESPFYFDDSVNIVNNPFIKDPASFADPFDRDKGSLMFNTRYLGFLSFMLDYGAHGLDVTGYHIVNISIHLINGLLVYWLMLLLFRTPALYGTSLAGVSGSMALLAALVFSLHPIQTQAVTYIVQRFASMAAMFYLGSICLFMLHRLSGKMLWYALSLLCALMAMFTKEISITLPLIIIVLELAFFEGRKRDRLHRLIPFALLVAVIPVTLLLGGLGGNLLSSEDLVSLSRNPVTSRIEYLLTQFGVITKYLRLLLLPYGQSIDHYQPVYGSFGEPEVFLPFLFLSALLGGACCLLYQSMRGRAGLDPPVRLVAFGVIWFFAALSVESSIIPITDLIFEHRVYLPSIGIIISAVTAVSLALSRGWPARAGGVIMALCLTAVIVYTPLTFLRNGVWSSGTLWEDAAVKYPRSTRAHANLCYKHLKENELSMAVEECNKAISLEPAPASAFYDLGVAYAKLGSKDRAMEVLRRGLERYPDDYRVNRAMGWMYEQSGDPRTAEHYLIRAVELNPSDAETRNTLGLVQYDMGDLESSARSFRKALSLDPDNLKAHNNLSVVLDRMGLREEAREHRRIHERLRSAPR